MRYFVSQHAGDLRFALGGHNQPSMHADESPGYGESVNGRILEYEKCERRICRVAARDEFVSEILDILADFRIAYKSLGTANLTEDALADFAFFGGRDHDPGFITQLWQV